MTYFDDDYPKMPSFRTSLRIVTVGALTCWITYPDWAGIRRELRDIGSASWNLLGWFIAWLALLATFMLAPLTIPIYVYFVRRQQKRVFIERKKRWLRSQLRYTCKGYDWS